MFVLIPAGGSGSRLWPLSRSHFPKHLLDLTGQGSMIQVTIDRIRDIVPFDQIYVITEASHADAIRKQLPQIPSPNFIVEPARRETAAVIGLGTHFVHHHDPKAVVASLHADHIITKAKAFREILQAAEQVATAQDVIVTIGIHPTSPATCYGYIASGKNIFEVGSTAVFKVDRFTEKPNLPTAQAFLAAGNYFWNAGMFIARTEVLLRAYRQFVPQLADKLDELAKYIGTPQEKEMIQKLYVELPKEPIDTAIMEKADNIVVIPADIGWSDIGRWDSLKQVLPNDSQGNLIKGDHIGIDTRDSLIYSYGGRTIGTIGLQNMIIVDNGDAILVCPMDKAELVKKLLKKVEEEKKHLA